MEVYKRAVDIVSQMTLTEKVNLTTGTGYACAYCSLCATLLADIHVDGSWRDVLGRLAVSPGECISIVTLLF